MTLEHLQNLFMSWGWVVMPEDWYDFERYAKQMLQRRRVLIINEGPLIEAILFFFITNDYETFYRKPIWDTPEDLEEGGTIFIDKLACRNWSITLRRLMRPMMENTFPWAEEVVYHRPLKNRCVRIKRRGVLV